MTLLGEDGSEVEKDSSSETAKAAQDTKLQSLQDRMDGLLNELRSLKSMEL